ncbi:MAG: serine/threonine protein kinase [Gammaproteobacteria bacterium]|nr:serine/threonine protein kinase [Gammaproteobacteria bacterium]
MPEITDSSLPSLPYAGFTPDVILQALEACGFEPTGGLFELNSYENRVYQVELEDGSFVVTKFYRPKRWTTEQIEEEHAFTAELAAQELPVVTPLCRDGESLFEFEGFRYAVYPRQGGHPPNLEIEENIKVLARTLARIHAVGGIEPFSHRPVYTVKRMGVDSRTFLLEANFLPMEMEEAYATITEHLLERLAPVMAGVSTSGRIHGDCHLGNLLWRNEVPHFVDFDDCVNGPPMQDLWMLLSGEREEQQKQLSTILEAYRQFCEFDAMSVRLIEPLRTLRIMYHAAWLARRWDDPAFPRAFPWFNTQRYWGEHVLNLREQLAALDEPPLVID